MNKLDRNLPYGEVFGTFADKPTAKYTQNGVFFDAAGNPLLTPEEKQAAKDALKAQLAALDNDDDTTPPPAPAPLADDNTPPPAPLADDNTGGPVAENLPIPGAAPVTQKQQKKATGGGKKKASAADAPAPSALPKLPD